jgi:Zn-finger nucleic acid-binding protein
MITIRPDSVAGKRCLIVCQDGRPVVTIWEDEVSGAEIAQKLMWLGAWHDTGELKELMTTVVELGGNFAQVTAAVQTYLLEKVNQKEV